MTDLEARLLAAHHDRDQPALVALYSEAASIASSDAAAGFFLTQAYVYALESGLPEADQLRAQLVSMGREQR